MRRSLYEQSLEVLAIIEKENIPTHIMYASNMTWDRLEKIVAKLQSSGLIEKQTLYNVYKKHSRYSLTDKGREVNMLAKNLNAKLDPIIKVKTLVPFP